MVDENHKWAELLNYYLSVLNLVGVLEFNKLKEKLGCVEKCAFFGHDYSSRGNSNYK